MQAPGTAFAAYRVRARGSARGLLLTLLLVALAAGGLAAPTHAQTDPVVAERYDVDLTVESDGTLAVQERLALDFVDGPYRHGQLRIRLREGQTIRDVQVGEPGRPYSPGRNNPNTFTAQREGARLHIDWWFPPTSNASRVFEISYRVAGTIRVYPDSDQVYWTAIQADHDYPIRAASVTVQVPGNAQRAAAYPERLRARIGPVDPRTIRIEVPNLPPDWPLIIRVQFPHGLVSVAAPPWQAEADREDWLNQVLRPALNFVLLLLGLLIPVAGLAALGLLWMLRGRDPGVARGARVLEEPPSDLPAPLVGTLLDEHADEHDVVATLVDLANRGVLRISPIQEPSPGGGIGTDYEIERLRGDDGDLREYERQVLRQLLGEDTTVRLSEARPRFVAALPYLKEALSEAVVREGLFPENPARVRQRYLQAGIALLALAVLGGIFFGGWLAEYADLAFVPFLGVGVLGAALLYLSRNMPQRTRAGALAADRWNAFRRYLAEAPPAEQGDAAGEVFNRYLPYAIVFGLNKSWIERFAAAGAPSPAWYGDAPVVVGGPVFYGGPGWGYGGPADGGHYGGHPGWPGGGGPGPVSVPDASGGAGWTGGPGGLQGVSDSLADMLNHASNSFGSGFGSGYGGSDWSSGGGGGWSGGGAGDFGGSSGGGGGSSFN